MRIGTQHVLCHVGIRALGFPGRERADADALAPVTADTACVDVDLFLDQRAFAFGQRFERHISRNRAFVLDQIPGTL